MFIAEGPKKYLSSALVQKSAKPTNENSPPIYRWDSVRCEAGVRVADG
jgi:hypothetical protein